MKRNLLLLFILAVMSSLGAVAEVINIQGTDYQTDVIIDRDLGPGVNYKRLRIPDFPLNVNMIIMDLNNPYNRVETTQGGEQLGKTETLANAYKRQYTAEKRPLAGANGNFWCVTNQYHWAEFCVGATFNGNVRNGEIITETNAHADWWGHNDGSPGCVAISPDKTMMIDFMYYKGWVKSEKFEPLVIQQTNKVVRDGEIGLYNHFFGRNKSFIPADQYTGTDGIQHMRRVENVSTEVYLKINEGHTWMVGRPMQCTVQEIKTDAGAGMLGDYDLCLVGRGVNKDALASLAVGDVVTIDLTWEMPDGTIHEIEQLIGGNGVVMVDGVLTDLNQIDSYNSKTYSRCAYGTTADRKTLVNVVIDMSTDPVYGRSAGCNTLVMCDIMKHYGCTNIMNMDAGGSAQMMVNGKVINTTTESTPRAVANGWFFYSIAPIDSVITRLEFDDVELKAPIYSTYRPKVLGYNQYGDLIDEDVQGFVLSCDASLGTCSGDTYTAAGTATTGQLTATLNGVSVSETMTVMEAEIAIRIKPTLLIDAVREYPMEVTATIDRNLYTYNPAGIVWKVDDSDIASIDENGVLRGLKEGTTRVIGEIGEFSDTTYVTVEIASAQELTPTDFTGWTAKGPSGITGVAMDEDGVISFTYGSPRGTNAYVEIVKDVRYYSIPDKLKMTFNSSIPVNTIYVDLRGAQYKPASLLAVSPSDGTYYEAGTDYEVEFPISHLGDPDDLIYYPVSVQSIRFAFKSQTSNKGAQTVTVKKLIAEYEHASGIENVLADNEADVVIYPNPVTDGVFTVSSSTEINKVELYAVSGANVLSKQCEGKVVTVEVGQLPQGIYIATVKTGNGATVSKLFVK